MKAPDLLQKAAGIMIERGKQYDKPEGERSMGAAVRAFNAITGRELTEPEGWLLLQVLKDVRQWQNPGRYHADSAEDCIAYAALKAEALAGMDGDQPEQRAQSFLGKAWDHAPEWAKWAAMDEDGDWFWYETKPGDPDINGYWNYRGETGDCQEIDGAETHPDWENSLESRP